MGGALDHDIPSGRTPTATLVSVQSARRRGRARDARAQLGTDRQRRLEHDDRADSLPQPLQCTPDGDGRYPEGRLTRGRRRRITVNTVATGKFATERLAAAVGSIEQAEELAAPRSGRPARHAAEYGDLVAFLCSSAPLRQRDRDPDRRRHAALADPESVALSDPGGFAAVAARFLAGLRALSSKPRRSSARQRGRGALHAHRPLRVAKMLEDPFHSSAFRRRSPRSAGPAQPESGDDPSATRKTTGPPPARASTTGLRAAGPPSGAIATGAGAAAGAAHRGRRRRGASDGEPTPTPTRAAAPFAAAAFSGRASLVATGALADSAAPRGAVSRTARAAFGDFGRTGFDVVGRAVPVVGPLRGSARAWGQHRRYQRASMLEQRHFVVGADLPRPAASSQDRRIRRQPEQFAGIKPIRSTASAATHKACQTPGIDP